MTPSCIIYPDILILDSIEERLCLLGCIERFVRLSGWHDRLFN